MRDKLGAVKLTRDEIIELLYIINLYITRHKMVMSYSYKEFKLIEKIKNNLEEKLNKINEFDRYNKVTEELRKHMLQIYNINERISLEGEDKYLLDKKEKLEKKVALMENEIKGLFWEVWEVNAQPRGN